jgi:Zn-dependent peptidase ImmA (M78 family)
VALVSAETLVELSRLEEIERLQTFAFSAATFEIRGRRIIVTNPLRTDERLASDVAHELAHLLLDHRLSEVREIDGVPFRTCMPEEEEQATAFGGTLLLPRPLLIAAARRGDGPAEIAPSCGVTLEMARYRYNTTGVAKQVHRRSG